MALLCTTDQMSPPCAAVPDLIPDQTHVRYCHSMADGELIESLVAAVVAAPDDVRLRVHLAEMLSEAGRTDEAIAHASLVLANDPRHERAQAVLRRAVGPGAGGEAGRDGKRPEAREDGRDFDWEAAKRDVAGIVEPPFVASATASRDGGAELARPSVSLADVGGLEDVKERLEVSFLGPMRHPELRRMFGKSLSGGLLLYGPPGCGKSFLAEALAGELGSSWISVQLHDVLDMWLGGSERNLHALFESARAAAPCVLFIDELDAIGQRRSNLARSAMRTTVNQLLVEMDGAAVDNDGVYVIGATNHPWDVDPALRRPGRFGHSLLVPPPDLGARVAILRSNLECRPIEGIDLLKAAHRTARFSGADLAQVCEMAAERALADSVRSGSARLIGMADLEAAIEQTRPSTGAWFDVARNVVMFANDDGAYNDLRAYMKGERLL